MDLLTARIQQRWRDINQNQYADGSDENESSSESDDSG